MGWRAKTMQWELISKPLARQMRREQTAAEAMLWTHVRGRKLFGMRFRRQHAIGRYIVDLRLTNWSHLAWKPHPPGPRSASG